MTQTELGPGRREQTKTVRRQAIVEVANARFLKHGYSQTSMSAIAADLGGSKGTLWSYFASKDELFAAVLQSSTEQFRSALTETLDPSHDPRQALASFCQALIRRITAPDAIALQRLVIAEGARFSEIGRMFDDATASRILPIVSHYFASIMPAVELVQSEPKEAARMLLALSTGGYSRRVLMAAEQPTDSAARREAEYIVTQLLRCYPTITAARASHDPSARDI